MLLRPLKFLMLMLALMAPSYADDGFLDPEDAFRFSARLVLPGLFEVRYLIADGYYMYQDRFRFAVEPESIVLGVPRFPESQWHEDEFFGRSKIFRNQVTIEIPIVSAANDGNTVRLSAVSQGCADAGICYLPTEQTMDFAMIGPFGVTEPK